LCALALGPASALRADFSWELAGRLGHDESEADFESDLGSLSATYYFDPVEEGTGPHALAAFFDPATRVSIMTSRDEATLPSGALDSETTDSSVSGLYLLPRSKWYVGGRYSRGDVDEPFPPLTTASSIDLTAHGVVAGKYLGQGATRLQVSLDRSKTESEQVLTICIPGCFTGIGTADVTSDDVRLDVMHVRPFRAATYALSGGVSDSSSDVVGSLVFIPNPIVPPFPNQTLSLDLGTLRTYFVAAEVFPIQKLGVRLGYTRLDGESVSGDVVDVEASWFFRRNIGLELTVSREETDDVSTDGLTLRAIGRF
jgi:hypothetical protein